MSPFADINERLNQLDTILSDLKTATDNNGLIWSKGYYDACKSHARSAVRTTFRAIFEREDDIDTSGPFGWFRYARNRYDDGVLFAYLAPDSVNQYIPAHGQLRAWRSDLFFKGSRWSRPEHRVRFYHHFNIIQAAIGADRMPMNLLAALAADADIKYLQIAPDTALESAAGALGVPYYVRWDNWNCPDYDSCTYKQLLNALHLCNEDSRSAVGEAKDSLPKPFAEVYHNAYKHFELHHGAVLEEWTKRFTTAGLFNGQITTDMRRHAFDVSTLLHYQDMPYRIHLFLGTDLDGKADNAAWLAISDRPDREIAEEPRKNVLKRLATSGSRLARLEQTMVARHLNDLAMFWRFESWHKREQPLYEALCHGIRHLLYTFCQQQRIPIVGVFPRVKQAASFFDRLVEAVNDPTETNQGIIISRLLSKGDLDHLPKYRHDIAGVRVVCLYNEDVERVVQFVADEEKSDLREDASRRKTMEHWDDEGVSGYRTVHLTVCPGENRLRLREWSMIQERECEIQVRSALSHGWADVSHGVNYKSGLPKGQGDPKKLRQLETGLRDVGQALALLDDKMNTIRTQYNELRVDCCCE